MFNMVATRINAAALNLLSSVCFWILTSWTLSLYMGKWNFMYKIMIFWFVYYALRFHYSSPKIHLKCKVFVGKVLPSYKTHPNARCMLHHASFTQQQISLYLHDCPLDNVKEAVCVVCKVGCGGTVRDESNFIGPLNRFKKIISGEIKIRVCVCV